MMLDTEILYLIHKRTIDLSQTRNVILNKYTMQSKVEMFFIECLDTCTIQYSLAPHNPNRILAGQVKHSIKFLPTLLTLESLKCNYKNLFIYLEWFSDATESMFIIKVYHGNKKKFFINWEIWNIFAEKQNVDHLEIKPFIYKNIKKYLNLEGYEILFY